MVPNLPRRTGGCHHTRPGTAAPRGGGMPRGRGPGGGGEWSLNPETLQSQCAESCFLKTHLAWNRARVLLRGRPRPRVGGDTRISKVEAEAWIGWRG